MADLPKDNRSKGIPVNPPFSLSLALTTILNPGFKIKFKIEPNDRLLDGEKYD
jgi:hypothetical protein